MHIVQYGFLTQERVSRHSRQKQSVAYIHYRRKDGGKGSASVSLNSYIVGLGDEYLDSEYLVTSNNEAIPQKELPIDRCLDRFLEIFYEETWEDSSWMQERMSSYPHPMVFRSIYDGKYVDVTWSLFAWKDAFRKKMTEYRNLAQRLAIANYGHFFGIEPILICYGRRLPLPYVFTIIFQYVRKFRNGDWDELKAPEGRPSKAENAFPYLWVDILKKLYKQFCDLV